MTPGQSPQPQFQASGLRGKLRRDEPMARHVSWRAGGRAERCYIPADLEDLAEFLATETGPVTFVGLGSNLLVRDGGMKGTIILLRGVLNRISLTSDGHIFAEAGVSSPKISSFAARHHLEGAEFLSGIPGTLGGALAMNAGCYERETWQCVDKVLTLDRHGRLHERKPCDYEISYRHVALREAAEEWFVAAWLRLKPGDGKLSRQKIQAWLERRMATQPLNQPSAGSVFRNPPGDHAARLIEACGLKGCTVGGARVSEKHANFIINLGHATASDIENLIEKVQITVQRQQGVLLIPEVRIVGERKIHAV